MEERKKAWSERRSTTLKDVAKSVGVSESTASVVLNGARSGTRVSDRTRQSVVDAAKLLGYRPNNLARSLLTGRTNRIGMYSGHGLDARNLFYAELLGGVFEVSQSKGLNTVVHTSGNGSRMLLDLVSDRAIDGLIVHAPGNDPILGLLHELRAPAVSVCDQIPGLASICVDDHTGGELLAQHVASLGHKKVLYKLCMLPPTSANHRQASFVKTATALGLEVLVSEHGPDQSKILTPEELDLLTVGSDRFTAVVAWSDYAGEYVCRSLRDHGISIPDQVAVLGFDGLRSFFSPVFELTTIRAPWAQVGKVAVETLLQLIAGETVPTVTTLPVEFVRGCTS